MQSAMVLLCTLQQILLLLLICLTANEGCVGFVFGGGSSDGPCYLKSTIQPAEANANEDLAILN